MTFLQKSMIERNKRKYKDRLINVIIKVLTEVAQVEKVDLLVIIEVGVAHIAHEVAVAIELGRVGHERAVVIIVVETVAVRVKNVLSHCGSRPREKKS